MENRVSELSNRLDSLDQTQTHENLKDYPDLQPILIHLLSDLDLGSNLKTLRQLLFYAESAVLEFLIINPEYSEQVIRFIVSSDINFDSSKLFVELFDESVHSFLITPDFVNKLVDAFENSDKKTCENLVKILILISNINLGIVINTKNSRFFGELLVLRVNWASGTEKKNLIKTISKIFKEFPDFFYMNDLKLIADTLVKVLVDREEEVLVECYEALRELFKLPEFVQTRYRFEDLSDILQHGEEDVEVCEIQYSLFNIINST